jgi:hypothetical protein
MMTQDVRMKKRTEQESEQVEEIGVVVRALSSVSSVTMSEETGISTSESRQECFPFPFGPEQLVL